MTTTATKYLVTGAAGFIGMHVAERLLASGALVLGIDNLNDYYDVRLKEARLAQLTKHVGFEFEKLDIAATSPLLQLFDRWRPDLVIHLAAQAGVRYSIENPHVYAESNVVGFLNILEGCRHTGIQHLVYASSSSVYGANSKMPFSTNDNVDRPVSLYAATKRANELMAYTYSHLYRIPTTGLRFFTVYGPWGRPDMAVFSFAKAIVEGRPIDLYNYGQMLRDFTYIDDIVEGVIRVSAQVATAHGDDPSSPPCKLYNIGNNEPAELSTLVEVLERCLQTKAKIRLQPMQAGDVRATYAEISDLTEAVGFRPVTDLEVGVRKFVEWYRGYYGV